MLNAQKLRREGFTQAVTDCHQSYRIITDINDISEIGGIICATEHYMLRVLQHLRYPNNIKIGGIDNISFLKCINSPVLTVEYSTDTIAKECMNYILGKPYVSDIEHKLVYNT